MHSRFVPRPARPVLILALLCALALPALAGPPWIAIEIPANPYDAATRDAFLVVHTYHHGEAANFALTGTAERMRDGRRETVALEFDRTSRPGAYALRRQWSDGAWLLVITVQQGKDDTATALVELSGDGAVASVRVPTRRDGGYTMPARVTPEEVTALLAVRNR